MVRENPTNVVAAFEMLLEEVEVEIDFVNQLGARAFETRDYDRAREALERAGLVTAFRDRIAALRREWPSTAGQEDDEKESSEEHVQRRDLGRLRRGLRTPEEAYFRPILQTLVELGGRGQMGQVIDRVGRLMQDVLRKWTINRLLLTRTACAGRTRRNGQGTPWHERDCYEVIAPVEFGKSVK
jgi:hypothetical protein